LNYTMYATWVQIAHNNTVHQCSIRSLVLFQAHFNPRYIRLVTLNIHLRFNHIYLVEIFGGWNPKEMQDCLEIGDTLHFEANVHHFAIYILAV
jgi:hypothetical protein